MPGGQGDNNTGESGNFLVPFSPAKVVYVYDEMLAKCTDKIIHIQGRSVMVHELIKCYGLLRFLESRESKPGTRDDLLKFHSKDYVDFLCKTGTCPLSEEDDGTEDQITSESLHNREGTFGMISSCIFEADNSEEFGLGYDCPIFSDMEEFALRIVGGTITAAEALVDGADIAINWCGGWHHAQRGEASGFCYVNDIVLGIHTLQNKFKHIWYIDLDSHHGDGVENAFAFSNKVMTLSFHRFETGYFPGTGSTKDFGKGRGKFHSINVPLKMGVTDQQFVFIFESIIDSVFRNFRPDAIVVQCGADSLARDPLGGFNLTLKSISHCVQQILKLRTSENNRIPTLLLGGGGYNIPNAARLWTKLTADAIGRKIGNDIPDNSFFLKYGPDFELEIQPSLRKNDNDDNYISEIIETLLGYMRSLEERKKT